MRTLRAESSLLAAQELEQENNMLKFKMEVLIDMLAESGEN